MQVIDRREMLFAFAHLRVSDLSGFTGYICAFKNVDSMVSTTGVYVCFLHTTGVLGHEDPWPCVNGVLAY